MHLTLLFTTILAPPIILTFIYFVFNKFKRDRGGFSLLRVVVGVVRNAFIRHQGKLPSNWMVNNEGLVIIRDKVRHCLSSSKVNWKNDSQNYESYLSLCGYKSCDKSCDKSSQLEPPCYLETAFIKPIMNIVSSREFPLSPLALIHTAQTIVAHRQLCFERSPELQLDCGITKLKEVSKGIEIEISCRVYQKEELVWKSTMTLLSRSKSTRSRNKRGGAIQIPTDDQEINEEGEAVFEVPEGLGWNYAKVSNDYNPHHLSRLTARFVGYPKPMIHGLWTLSKVISILNAKVYSPSSSDHTPYPLMISAQFKKPLYIPNAACLKYKTLNPLSNESLMYRYKDKGSQTIEFHVLSGTKGAPPPSLNLVGFVTYNAHLENGD